MIALDVVCLDMRSMRRQLSAQNRRSRPRGVQTPSSCVEAGRNLPISKAPLEVHLVEANERKEA
jgi:hypothetical protein